MAANMHNASQSIMFPNPFEPFTGYADLPKPMELENAVPSERSDSFTDSGMTK